MPKSRLRHLQESGYPIAIAFRTKGIALPPAARRCVVDAARHYDGQRYTLYHVVCMPDHVHMILTPLPDSSGVEATLARIVHGIKSYTAHAINRLMKRRGSIWERGYYDRVVRTEGDFWEKMRYVAYNPVRSGLAAEPQSYAFAWNRWYDGSRRHDCPPARRRGLPT